MARSKRYADFSSRLIPARFVLSGLRVLILWQILFPAFCSAETGPVRVVVTASHDQALFHWIKAAQAGIIPPEGNRVIHYDSHPDMGVPDCNPGNTWPKQGDPDISCVDIASFQLGAVWKGLVSNIVWVRPPTAEQFDNGTYSFHIGESAGGRLKVDLPRDYYLADRAWAPKETLKRPVAVTMRVVPYHQLASVLKKNDQKVILDIDMDSFSTRNPGMDFLLNAGSKRETILEIKQRFDIKRLRIARNPAQRFKDIEAIKNGIADLVDAPWYKAVAALPGLFMKGIGIGDLFAVKKGLDQIDPSLPIGPILDNFETAISLPEYLPDEKEMEILLAAILEHLASGRITPLVITISRSVRGGFTPPDVCETYERKLLKGLSSVLGNIIVQYDL